jgi:hypothetical protein
MSRHKTRIMYIEQKAESLNGPARIGRVTYSKSGRSLTYDGRTFLRVGNGFKYNHIDLETGEPYWVSGPRRDGRDRLYPESRLPVVVDVDVAAEYWRTIRGQ